MENPYTFYYRPLAIATVLLLVLPGHGWRERVTGVVTATVTAFWFHRWIVHVRADVGRHALAHRLVLAVVGVVLTSALAVIHDAYLVVLLMLAMHFFVALPVGWSVLL